MDIITMKWIYIGVEKKSAEIDYIFQYGNVGPTRESVPLTQKP